MSGLKIVVPTLHLCYCLGRIVVLAMAVGLVVGCSFGSIGIELGQLECMKGCGLIMLFEGPEILSMVIESDLYIIVAEVPIL